MYMLQLSGLIKGEFPCPICQSINNGILPSYSLHKIPDYDEKLVTIYMDALSEVIKSNKGYIIGGKMPTPTTLEDLRSQPVRVMSKAIDHFVHGIHLIDIRGLSYFIDSLNHESNLLSSLGCLLKFNADPGSIMSNTLDIFMDAYLMKEMSDLVLVKNINGTLIKALLCISVLEERGINEQIACLLDVFYPLLSYQILLSVAYRKNSGKYVETSENEIKHDEFLNNLHIEGQL